MVALAESWLQQRTAHVVVEGQFSDKMVLKNMVFQGTVLGPTLWNLFYEDARRAIHETGFEEIVYADDLNGFKEFAHNASVVSVLAEAKKCQTELRKWGRANQVSFDPAKESVHIVSHAQPYGDPFKIARNLLRWQTPDGPCCTRRGPSGFLETDHDPEDQTLPRRLATCASLHIEGPLVCGVPHPCSVPRGQNNPGGNRRGAEALSS